MLKVYERTDLKNKIDEIEYDLLTCEEHQEINGLFSLTFTLPTYSEYKKYFNEDDSTKYLFEIDKRLYYFISKDLDTDTQQINITCRSVITLMDKFIFIPIYPIQVAKTAKDVMTFTLETYQDLEDENNLFEFKLFTDEELSERGMKWMSEKFDILNGFDYTTGYQMIGNCINLAGRGELYFENFKFAIVERIGKDTGKIWDKEKNMTSLKISKNYDSLMNVILIEGRDGMPLDIKEFPNSIISDSESIMKYGVRRGYISFSDIDVKDDLKRRALWEIDELNPDRVSIPKITISCDAYNAGDVKLGDSVRLLSEYDDIDDIKRIVSYDINWIERALDKYSLGDKPLTELQLLAKLEASRQTLNNITDSNGEVDTSLVNLIVSAIEGRNRCKNSKFAIFDKMSLPQYWTANNGYVASDDARFGTYSLSLVDNGYVISDVMNCRNWEEESDMTLIQVWHKGSFEIVIIGTDDTGNYDDFNPIVIPHSTKYSSSKVGRSQFSSRSWSTTPGYLVIDNLDLPENGNFRIMIQGTTVEDVRIGGVYCGPGNLSQIKLYSDGPNSDRFDELGVADVLFTREKNSAETVINSQMEEVLTNIQLEASSNTQLNMELLTILSCDDEQISCNLKIYDNAELKYNYPFKVIGGGQNTLCASRIMDGIEAGAHVFEFKLFNNGVNPITVKTDDCVFSMQGKFVEMEEVPPIPVINIYDYILFNNIGAENEILNMQKNIGIFDAADEVRMEFI